MLDVDVDVDMDMVVGFGTEYKNHASSGGQYHALRL